MINLNKNKKAVSYFLLMTIFSLVLFSFSFIIYVSPTKAIIEDIQYGQTTKEADRINYKLAAQKFYVKEEIEKSVQRAKIDFSKSYGVDKNVQMEIAESSCTYANLKLWYNEKNIEENVDEILEEETDEMENIENSEDLDESKESINENLCLPSFGKDTKTNLEVQIKEQIKKDLKEGLSPIKISNEPEVKTSFLGNGNLKVDIEVYFEENTKIGKIKDISKYSETFDISSYPKLLEAISLSLGEFSQKAKEEVPICIKENEKNKEEIEGQNIEIKCIENSLITLIEEKFLELEGTEKDFSKYEFKISDMKLKEDNSLKGYYALKVEVLNTNTKENELVFGAIFKDNIPNVLVSFSQELFIRADNTIKVRIFEPEESSDINSYIVIYSYEDFFNEQTYIKYSDFIKMLETNLVPKDFEQAGFYDESGAYYFSKESSNMNLNLLLVSPSNFKEDETTKQKYKDILLYQTYNNEKKLWELFEEKPIYVYVFAADYNKNYYVKDLSGKSKVITPQKVFGPKPLVNDNNPNTVDTITELKQELNIPASFSFEIKGYTDSNFDHYDMYITQNREANELKEKCQNIEFTNCYYYDGSTSLRDKTGKFLVTTDAEVSKEGFDKIIYFNEDLIQSGIEYEILIVPVDINGKGLISSKTKEYSFKITNDNHYELIKETERLDPKYFKLTLIDNKKPDPLTSISLLSDKLNLIEEKYYLQWTKVEEDITGVYVLYQAKDITGVLKSQNIVLVGLDGFILENNPSFSTIEITKIIPVDSSANKEDIRTYQGQTYTASYP